MSARLSLRFLPHAIAHAQSFFSPALLATYMRRMRNNNLEITIAGSSCRPQLINSTILCGTANLKC